MQHAIAAIEGACAARRSRWPTFVAAGVVAMLVPVAIVASSAPAEVDPCPLPTRTEVWPAATRDAVLSALQEKAAPSVDIRWTLAQFDRFASQWGRARTQVCDSNNTHRDDQLICMHRAAARFTASTETIASTELNVGRSGLLRGQPDSWTCTTVREHREATVDEPARRPPDAYVLRQVAEAEALLEVGDVGSAEAKLAPLLSQLDADDGRDTTGQHAAALILVGRVRDQRDDILGAIEAVEAAFFLSSQVERYRESWDAAFYLAQLTARQGKHIDALRWLRHADAAAIGDRKSEVAMASSHNLRASVLLRAQRPAQAEEELEKALALCGSCGLRMYIDANLGLIRLDAGKPAEARELLQHGHALIAEEFGGNDPLTLQSLVDIGETYHLEGDHKLAAAYARIALGKAEVDVARGAVVASDAWALLADTYRDSDNPEGAVEAARRSVSTIDPFASQHSGPARRAFGTLMWALLAAGQLQEALTYARRDLEFHETPDGHHYGAQYRLGEVLTRLGRYEEAEKWLVGAASTPAEGESLSARDRAVIATALGRASYYTRGCDHARRHFDHALELAKDAEATDIGIPAAAITGLAYCQAEQGQFEKARSSAEAAWEMIQSRTGSEPGRGFAALLLSHLVARQDPNRALLLRRSARTEYRRARNARGVAAVDAAADNPRVLPKLMP